MCWTRVPFYMCASDFRTIALMKSAHIAFVLLLLFVFAALFINMRLDYPHLAAKLENADFWSTRHWASISLCWGGGSWAFQSIQKPFSLFVVRECNRFRKRELSILWSSLLLLPTVAQPNRRQGSKKNGVKVVQNKLDKTKPHNYQVGVILTIVSSRIRRADSKLDSYIRWAQDRTRLHLNRIFSRRMEEVPGVVVILQDNFVRLSLT